MALDLDDVALFVRAATTGNLSEAGRQLGLTPLVASRRLARLEAGLRTRLMHRTTRRSGLTADGEAFLAPAERLLADAALAEGSVGPDRHAPRGLLRVTAPATFGRKIIAPLAPAFLHAHPDVRLDLQLTDAVVDLVEEGIDVAIRIAALRDSRLTARKLAGNPLVLVASPSYLLNHGTPRSLDELASHECLTRTGSETWSFEGGSATPRQVRVHGRYASNANEALRDGALAGLGIGLHSLWDIADHVERGELTSIELSDARPRTLAIWAVWPGGRDNATPKVRAFVEVMATRLTSVLGVDEFE